MSHATPGSAPAGRPGRYLATVALGAMLGGCLIAAAFEWVGVATGATLLPRELAAVQNDNRRVVVLPPDIRHWAALKLPRIAHEQPEVVLIGSSRGNEVRSAMFAPYRFYNASLTAWSLEQVRAMLDHVTQVSRPRVVMLSLDYFMLAKGWDQSMPRQRSMLFDDDARIKFESFLNLVRSLRKYPELWRSRFPDYLFGPRPAGREAHAWLGIDAIRVEAGFRWDGSFLYDAGQIATAPQQTRDNKGLLEAMPGGDHIDPAALAQLGEIARLAHARQVTLIAVQWPILKASTEVLDDDAGYRPYAGVWREFQDPATAAALQALGIEFHDLSRLAINTDSRNFFDAAHPNEAGMLAAIIALDEDARFRSQFPAIDVERLRGELGAARAQGDYFAIYRDRY